MNTRSRPFSLLPNWRTVLPVLLLIIPVSIVLCWAIPMLRPGGSEASADNRSAAIPPSPPDIESGVASIPTSNYANRKLEYFYYFPTRLLNQPHVRHPVLVIVPGLSGRVKKADPETYGKAVGENGWIILAPRFIFDKRNWETATSYQFPEAWSGQALLDILKDFSMRRHLKLGRAYLHGVSAGAQFVVRFALWRPELCLAVSAHAGGGTITPREFVPVKFFISIGRLDSTRRRQFDWFQQKAKELGISVQSRIYEGGHVLPQAQVQDSIRFYKEITNESLPQPGRDSR